MPPTAPPPYVPMSPLETTLPVLSPAHAPLPIEDETRAAQVRADRERLAREFDERLGESSPEPQSPSLEVAELSGPEFLYASRSLFVGHQPDSSAGSFAPERDASASRNFNFS